MGKTYLFKKCPHNFGIFEINIFLKYFLRRANKTIDDTKKIIVWDNNRGGWSYTDVERKITLKPFGRSEANASEVVGNEFENPGLLKP